MGNYTQLADHLIRVARRSKKSGFFVTGTDTGIGKTHVTRELLKELKRRGVQAVGFKPICCGDREDSLHYWKLLGRKIPLELVNPIYLKQPVAPISQPSPSWNVVQRKIVTAFKQLKALGFEMILVEGAGGILCPITRDHTMRDLVGLLKIPAIMVVPNKLGVLNQSLLTHEALKAQKLECVAVVLNQLRKTRDASQKSNARVLKKLVSSNLFSV